MESQARGAAKGNGTLGPPEMARSRPEGGGVVSGRLEAVLEEIDAVLEQNAEVLKAIVEREPPDEGDA